MEDPSLPTAADFAQLAVVHGPGTAWTQPHVSARWSRLFRSSVALTLACLLGLGLAAIGLHTYNVRDHDLLDHGVRTTGVVVGGGSEGRRGGSEYLLVEYRIADGRIPVRRRLHGPGLEEHPKGERLTVYYDPEWPSTFRTSEWSNRNGFFNTVVHLAALLFGLGVLGATVRWVRLLRWRGWLRRGHVHTIRVVQWEREMRGPLLETVHARVQAQGTDEQLDTLLRFSSSVLTGPELDEVIEVCPGPGRRLLVASEGSRRLWEARLPRSRAELDDWWSNLSDDTAPS